MQSPDPGNTINAASLPATIPILLPFWKRSPSLWPWPETKNRVKKWTFQRKSTSGCWLLRCQPPSSRRSSCSSRTKVGRWRLPRGGGGSSETGPDGIWVRGSPLDNAFAMLAIELIVKRPGRNSGTRKRSREIKAVVYWVHVNLLAQKHTL